MVLLARVRYREKSPAPKVTGGGQGSGWGRASHGEVDDISERKEMMSRTVVNATCCLDFKNYIMANYVIWKCTTNTQLHIPLRFMSSY